ncbi:MAG: hypothetical protein DMF62_16765 [Acidobacteria bacterium]|nr:MAG: hypothetical protein DMF62_16765 [Acidobacteriota bacterium]
MIFKEEETEMKKFKNIIAVSAFSLMVLALPAIASAQWGGNNGGYPNGGYPNGSYGNTGRYGTNLENVADRLKDRSRDFERQVDREFRNNGRYNNGQYGNTGILGTIFGGGGMNNRGYGNDNIKRMAEDFRRAAADFENRTDGNNNRNGQWGRGDSRDQQSAQRLLSIGSQLDNELRRMRMSSTLQYQWNAIRSDLNIVANTYRNSGGYNRGGNRNGSWPF